MTTIHHILAAGDDGFGKVLFGLIFLLLWGVSAIMSQVSKQKEKERRERVRRELEGTGSAPPIIIPPIPAPRQPPPILRQLNVPPIPTVKPQRPQAQASPRRKIFPKLKIPRGLAPQPAQPKRSPFAETVRPPPIAPASIVAAAPASPPRPVSATAGTLRAWLRPNTLRQQFILTEVLQPPVGLRE